MKNVSECIKMPSLSHSADLTLPVQMKTLTK